MVNCITNAELKDKTEDSLHKLIDDQHRAGLNYWEILGIFYDFCTKLYLQATAEYRMNLEK
jgi:hypothetical protein